MRNTLHRRRHAHLTPPITYPSVLINAEGTLSEMSTCKRSKHQYKSSKQGCRSSWQCPDIQSDDKKQRRSIQITCPLLHIISSICSYQRDRVSSAMRERCGHLEVSSRRRQQLRHHGGQRRLHRRRRAKPHHLYEACETSSPL